MKRRYFLMILVGAVLVTGCASTTDSPVDNTGPENGSETSTEVNQTIEVNGGNFYFEPENIEVEKGETVRFEFVNDGGTHDMRIPELDVGTEVISGGETESFTVTFDEEGEIEFLCSVGNHAERGMTGTITVS